MILSSKRNKPTQLIPYVPKESSVSLQFKPKIRGLLLVVSYPSTGLNGPTEELHYYKALEKNRTEVWPV